eukprot:NODE_383_length_8356_cov_0.477898.p2 type:complete len:671 gc:universal NODE_383_length_8356_cov_0.477898:3519-5531(+)
MIFLNIIFGVTNMDCLNAIQLAYDMNMPQAAPSNWASLNADCCQDSPRTVCDTNGRVTRIEWKQFADAYAGNSLNGVLNYTALSNLPFLQYFDVEMLDKTLSGPVPRRLPESVTYFSLYGNDGMFLNATDFVAPTNIQHLDFGYVNIVGEFPKDAFPKSLDEIVFYMSGSLTGSLYFYAPISVDIEFTNVKKMFIFDTRQVSGTFGNSGLSLSQIAYLPPSCTRTGVVQDTDCQHLKTFAEFLNMDIVNPLVYGQVTTDCCSAKGVICDSTKTSILQLDWSGMSLDGHVDVPTLEYFSLLKSLNISNNFLNGNFPLDLYSHYQTLDISNNLFDGPITEIVLPGIVSLNISNNKFTGNLPKFPDSLQSFVLNNNHLTGPIPIPGQSLRFLDVSHNQLSGSIPPMMLLESLLANNNRLNGTIPNFSQFLKVLDVSNNRLSGLLPILNIKIGSVNVSNNSMSGDLTNIAFPSSLKIVDFSFNNFNGALNLKTPIYVNVEQNGLTDITFLSTSGLLTCNIFNNLIRRIIPPCNFYTSDSTSTSSGVTVLKQSNSAILKPSNIESIKSTSNVNIIATRPQRTTQVIFKISTLFVTTEMSMFDETSGTVPDDPIVSTEIKFEFPARTPFSINLNAFVLIRFMVSGVLLGMMLVKVPWKNVFAFKKDDVSEKKFTSY